MHVKFIDVWSRGLQDSMMGNHPAPALIVQGNDLVTLANWARIGYSSALCLRARIVLLAEKGVSNTAISQVLRVSRPTVIGWRQRYVEFGLAGLRDKPRSGRPRTIDREAIVRATLLGPPDDLALDYWTARSLAAHLGVAASSVSAAWTEHKLVPRQQVDVEAFLSASVESDVSAG